MSSAEIFADLTSCQDEGLDSSWIADSLVPTNILNQHDSDWRLVNTVRDMFRISSVRSVSITLDNCAPVRTPHNSNRGIVYCRLGATLELSARKATCTYLGSLLCANKLLSQSGQS